MPEIQKMHKMKIVIEYKDETALWNALEVLGGNFENQILQMPVELGPAFRLGCGNPGKWRILSLLVERFKDEVFYPALPLEADDPFCIQFGNRGKRIWLTCEKKAKKQKDEKEQK